MLKLLSIALAFVAVIAHAQGAVSYGYYNNDGEVIYLESRDNSIFLPKAAAALEKAGYTRLPTPVPPGVKTDTWCKVDVYRERQILGECYTPQMGHGVSVRNHLTWTQAEFRGDYSGVMPMIAKIRDDHRRASAYLKAVSSSVQYPLNEAAPTPDKK